MTQISLNVTIDAPARRVWEHISDLASHTEWMHDAVAIRFVSAATSGIGTQMECDTRVGPFRLTDRLVVTEWAEGHAMAIRHVGTISGTGRFTLQAAGPNRTRFSWTEDLRFPWWLGGTVAATAARPVLARTWRRNLSNLRALIEGGQRPARS
jgi:uncharacterized protein YndB with AHSA1/START domain